ncbi:hypothetical protein PtrSN001C_010570, partial [Pyrenophora tritici-repentis]
MLLTRGPMDVGKPPAFNEEHASPLIQILAWLFLSFSISAVVAQFATKTAMSKRLIGADYVLLAALVLAIGQSAALLSPAGQVIGNTETGLSRETVLRAWKALYSAEILSVMSLVAAKGSLLILLDAATPFTTHRRMLYGTSAITVFWGLSAVFLIAFQCPSQHRSNITNPQCIDIRAVRIFIASMNIVTDLALAIVPTLMVLPLQLSPEKRLTLLIGVWSLSTALTATALFVAASGAAISVDGSVKLPKIPSIPKIPKVGVNVGKRGSASVYLDASFDLPKLPSHPTINLGKRDPASVYLDAS